MNVNVYINGHTTRDDEETNCTDRPFMLHFYLIGYNGCPGVVCIWGFWCSHFHPFTTIFLLKKKLGPLFKLS